MQGQEVGGRNDIWMVASMLQKGAETAIGASSEKFASSPLPLARVILELTICLPPGAVGKPGQGHTCKDLLCKLNSLSLPSRPSPSTFFLPSPPSSLSSSYILSFLPHCRLAFQPTCHSLEPERPASLLPTHCLYLFISSSERR